MRSVLSTSLWSTFEFISFYSSSLGCCFHAFIFFFFPFEFSKQLGERDLQCWLSPHRLHRKLRLSFSVRNFPVILNRLSSLERGNLLRGLGAGSRDHNEEDWTRSWKNKRKKLQLNFRGRKSKSCLPSSTVIREWRSVEKRGVKAFLPTGKAAEFTSLADCRHWHQKRATGTGTERTPSPQKLPCVPSWFPSCPSADPITSFCLSFPLLHRLSAW